MVGVPRLCGVVFPRRIPVSHSRPVVPSSPAARAPFASMLALSVLPLLAGYHLTLLPDEYALIPRAYETRRNCEYLLLALNSGGLGTNRSVPLLLAPGTSTPRVPLTSLPAATMSVTSYDSPPGLVSESDSSDSSPPYQHQHIDDSPPSPMYGPTARDSYPEPLLYRPRVWVPCLKASRRGSARAARVLSSCVLPGGAGGSR